MLAGHFVRVGDESEGWNGSDAASVAASAAIKNGSSGGSLGWCQGRRVSIVLLCATLS